MTLAMQNSMSPLRPDATDAEIAMAQEYLARLEVTATAGHETLAEFVNNYPAVVLGFQPTKGSTKVPKEFQGTWRDRAVNVWRAFSESRLAKAGACAATILGAIALSLATSGKTARASAPFTPVILQPPVFANTSFCLFALPSPALPIREEIFPLNDFDLEEDGENTTDCDSLTPSFYPEAETTPPLHTNASICPAAQVEGEEDEVMCLAGNATETVFRGPQAKERSNLEVVKDIAIGVAIVSSAIMKGIAAATTTAVGSIFVAGTLME